MRLAWLATRAVRVIVAFPAFVNWRVYMNSAGFLFAAWDGEPKLFGNQHTPRRGKKTASGRKLKEA